MEILLKDEAYAIMGAASKSTTTRGLVSWSRFTRSVSRSSLGYGAYPSSPKRNSS